MNSTSKTANQLWKESGTTLSFKNWVDREKQKYMNADGSAGQDSIMINKALNDSIQNAIKDVRTDGGLQTQANNKTILGINKTVVVVGSILIVGAIAFKIFYHKSAEK